MLLGSLPSSRARPQRSVSYFLMKAFECVLIDWCSLQWPKWKKMMILIICSLYSFLGNSALLGPSVYIGIFAEVFAITPTKASGLISYPNIMYGVGTMITVPSYLKFGRRPVMLASLLIYLAGLAGASRSNSYGSLMACRIIHAFASGVCEALPVQLVNDIFFRTCNIFT